MKKKHQDKPEDDIVLEVQESQWSLSPTSDYDYREIKTSGIVFRIYAGIQEMEEALINYNIEHYDHEINFEEVRHNFRSYKFDHIALSMVQPFKSNGEYRKLVSSLLSRMNESDKRLFIDCIYKLMSILEEKECSIEGLLLELYRKDCYLKGISPFLYKDGETSEPEKVENSLADDIRIKMTHSKDNIRGPLYKRILEIYCQKKKGRGVNHENCFEEARKEIGKINPELAEYIDQKFDAIKKGYDNWRRRIFPDTEPFDLGILNDIKGMETYKGLNSIKDF